MYAEGEATAEGRAKFRAQQQAQTPVRQAAPGQARTTVVCGIDATSCPDYTPTACMAKYRCRYKKLVEAGS